MRWSRQAYLEHLLGIHSEREMFVELFGPLLGTDAAWREQGAREEEIDLTAFAFDHIPQFAAPVDLGPRSGLPEREVLSETPALLRFRDGFGRVMELPKKTATLPLPRDYPVKGPADWERVRPWFAFSEDRVDAARVADCARQRKEEDGVVRFPIWGGYDFLRNLMGDEEACLAFIEEPEMVEDMLATVGDLAAACLDRIAGTLPLDVLFVHEDFAGKSGPLVGPAHVRAFLAPYYRRLWEKARRLGARIFDLDSDGFVDPVVEALIEGGVNCLHPVEPAAGSDPVALRKRFGPGLILRGGLDKFALTRGKAAIDAEIAYKCQSPLRGGGMMFGLDHRIPSEVPVEAYRYYVRAARAALGLPPPEQDSPGWRRMA